jgi:rubrerythrin
MNKTVLYVKISPKGLFYLGKTDKNPFIYMGSGFIWKRHLKKYYFNKDDIQTFIVFESHDLNEIRLMGQYFSDLFNVVKDSRWANLRPENGDGGDTSHCKNYKPFPIIYGDRHWTKKQESKKFLSERIKGEKNPAKRQEVKEKIRLKAIGRRATEETKKKLSEMRKGENNSFFNKKHKEETKIMMKEKANGRYSSEWFLKKYGENEGIIKHNEFVQNNKLKLKIAQNTPRKTYTCPKCGLIGKGSNMKRYHFENCKIIW